MYSLYAGDCSFNKDYTNGCDTRIRNFVRHANIVQRVKSCYKIKIDSGVLVCCFYGVLLCKQHPSITIAPLLSCNSGKRIRDASIYMSKKYRSSFYS